MSKNIPLVALLALMLIMALEKLMPSAWSDAYPLVLAVILVGMGAWIGIGTWRRAQAPDA